MNFPADASNWMDVFDHIAVVVGAIVLAAVPSYFAARNHKSLVAVRDQVENKHTSNLRDDVDRVIHAVEALSNDVRGLRSDLAAEEERRRSAIKDVYHELDHRIGRHRRED